MCGHYLTPLWSLGLSFEKVENETKEEEGVPDRVGGNVTGSVVIGLWLGIMLDKKRQMRSKVTSEVIV